VAAPIARRVRVRNDWGGFRNFCPCTERLLYFTTKPSEEHGFEYRFEGEFLVKDFDTVAGKNKAAVRGKLTKFRNGRKLAEQTLTFRVEYLEGC
jgi:hypothetical protein